MQNQPSQKKKLPEGVSALHTRRCATKLVQGRCDCKPSYRASVYDQKTRKKILSPSFATVGEAVTWRNAKRVEKDRGTLRPPSQMTLREVFDEWHAGVTASPPMYKTRKKTPYKAAAIRNYVRLLRIHVLDDLGAHKLSAIHRTDVQALIDRLRGKGLSEGSIGNVITGLRVLFRHGLERGYVEANPTVGFSLGGGGKRTRNTEPEEAAELLAVLPDSVRGVYTMAAYAGLRRGEIRAIRWQDISLADRLITVRAGWDDVDGEIKPKTESSTDRQVPINTVLYDYLTELKASSGRSGRDFVFGPSPDRVFEPNNARNQANRAWKQANVIRAEWGKPPLVPVTLHELRHSYVSMMHAAGVQLETISDYVGHSGLGMTNAYRHLQKRHSSDSTAKMDAYLARADSAARIAQLEEEEA